MPVGDAHEVDGGLAQTLVELADTLVEPFDVVDYLSRLAARMVALLPVDAAGVVLADLDGTLRSIGSSQESARLLDLFELQNQEGPCLDCLRSGEPVRNVVLADATATWPRFAPEAQRAGFAMAHALPMRLRGHVIGAVNLFSTTPVPLGPEAVSIGQALADMATVGLLQERTLREVRIVNEQLQHALTSRVVIEQAKGMLAEQLQVDPAAAFDRMRAMARSRRQRLIDVATAVLERSLDLRDL